MRVSAELSGEELLDALRANPATEYLVVEETGEIYGVLSAPTSSAPSSRPWPAPPDHRTPTAVVGGPARDR
ncbi:hypothetical protein SVIOM342S_06068 [Streptomyces violaceorubidus]